MEPLKWSSHKWPPTFFALYNFPKQKQQVMGSVKKKQHLSYSTDRFTLEFLYWTIMNSLISLINWIS